MWPSISRQVIQEKDTISILRDLAVTAASRSYSPYTGLKQAVVVLLEDGATVPGVRVENASFSLTISPLINAVSTLHAIGRVDICAIVSSVPFNRSDMTYAASMPNFEWTSFTSDALTTTHDLPDPREVLSPLIPDWGEDPASGAREARDISELAHIPESDFPVGCVIRSKQGHHLPGVNVEHPDWSQILCAERNVLSTAVSYGFSDIQQIFVSCPKEPGGTPCGACRQVILELAPDATVWMDRGNEPPGSMLASELLPGHFTGDILRKRAE